MKRLKHAGLSLVELLIGIALASVIIAGIVQVFLANRQAFTLTESLVRVQENGRFAIDFIGAAARDAGNYGCVPEYLASSDNIKTATGDDELKEPSHFRAVNKAEDGVAPSAGIDAPDELGLFTVTAESAQIDNTVASAAGELALSNTSGTEFDEDDWLLVSNCEVGDFIIAGAATTNTTIDISDANTNEFRLSQYQRLNQVSTVHKVRRYQFSVNTDDDTLQVLIDDDAVPQDLIDGIANIQFEYGVDTDGNFEPDFFDKYNDVPTSERGNIIAIKIYVLAVSNLETTDNVVTAPQTLDFAEWDDVVMTDNRLYKTFESTVLLRNRVN